MTRRARLSEQESISLYVLTIPTRLLILTVRNGDDTYKIGICLQMKNEFDPTREGVHLIEVLTADEIKSGIRWKEKDDEPGVYVLE